LYEQEVGLSRDKYYLLSNRIELIGSFNIGLLTVFVFWMQFQAFPGNKLAFVFL
jgi:hypothetical protein